MKTRKLTWIALVALIIFLIQGRGVNAQEEIASGDDVNSIEYSEEKDKGIDEDLNDKDSSVKDENEDAAQERDGEIAENPGDESINRDDEIEEDSSVKEEIATNPVEEPVQEELLNNENIAEPLTPIESVDEPQVSEVNKEAAILSTAAATEITLNRLGGANRYETAIKIAEELKTVLGVNKFGTIVLASGVSFPDALSGGYLASQKNAPILLTAQSNVKKITDYIKSNLEKGGKVYILGGTSAVSSSAETYLKGLDVKRLGGSDRYETNLLILKEAKAAVNSDDILICSGTGFPDALSASSTDKPIMIVGSKLRDPQKNYLKGNFKNYYLIGGTGAVSSDVEKTVKSYGETERVWGKDRYITSIEVAKKFSDKSLDDVVVASATAFPDGLAGGPLAVAMGCPLVLANDSRPADARNYAVKAGVTNYVILGGQSIIPDAFANTKKAVGITNMGDKYKVYFEKDGTIRTSQLFDQGNKKYYSRPNGLIAQNMVFEYNGKWYGASKDGSLVKGGFYKLGGKEYYFLSDYTMPTKMAVSYKYNYLQSPNYGNKNSSYKGAVRTIETIVIHHWGDGSMSFSSVTNWFLTTASQVSAHYVAMDGKVTQMVAEDQFAWHGGGAFINKKSIGIECRPAKTAGDMNTVAELVCDIWVRNHEIVPLSEHHDYVATACPGIWKASEVYDLAKKLLVKKAS